MAYRDRVRKVLLHDGAYRAADAVFARLERRELRQNRNLAMIPNLAGRKGGTHTISEWAYTIGLMQAVIHQNVGHRTQLDVLDVGCGTGRLSLAVAPLLGDHGRYVGIDVNKADISFCEEHYCDPRAEFIHLQHSNRMYASEQATAFTPYPFRDASFDVATGLSVWTHLNEADGTYYLSEVARCLRPGGKAVITFFKLDDGYARFLQTGIVAPSSYSFRSPANYRFDQSVDGSDAWYCPEWALETPEFAIGVTDAGIGRLLQASGLELVAHHPGQWKNAPGLFFQDVLILRKPT